MRIDRRELEKGARGIGEQKFEVDADSAPLRRVYEVAREYGVPVPLHFGSRHDQGPDRVHKILERLKEYLPGPLMLRRITCDNRARMLRLRT